MTKNLDKIWDRIGSVSKDTIIETVLKDERAMALKLRGDDGNFDYDEIFAVIEYIDYRIHDIERKGEHEKMV